MRIDKVSYGDNWPEEVNVIIEIPSHGDPVKYEVDKDTGAMFVDRFMTAAMHYPCNYGYIPKTLSSDGDPIDVLVLAPYPLLPGSVVKCRPISVLNTTDQSGDDPKVLMVPISSVCSEYDNYQTVEDVCPHLLGRISHFFEHYKDLEEGKWARVSGWGSVSHAKDEITNGISKYLKPEEE